MRRFPMQLLAAGTAALWLAAPACREATKPSNGQSTTSSTTVTIDTLTGSQLDVADQWGAPVLLVGADQSLHILSLDQWNERLRYHTCATACTDASSWSRATTDTGAYDYGNSSFAGAVLTASGIHAVRTVTPNGLVAGPAIRYAHCAGGCGLAANWSTSDLFMGGAWIPTKFWYGNGAPLAADASGGLHLLFERYVSGTIEGLVYAACASACGDSTSWTATALDSTGVSPYAPRVIAVAPNGAVHVLYQRGSALMHASCSGGCASAAAWQSGAIPGISLTGGMDTLLAVSVAFGPGGRMDLAYLDGSAGVTYATCAGPCAAPGVWSKTTLPLTTSDVSLAESASGTLYVATVDSTAALSSCAAGCLSASGWTTVRLASALGGLASVFGGKVAVAVDSAGRPMVASANGGGPQVLQFTRILP